MNISASRIERYFEKYEFSTPYLLCSSDCETWSIEEILELEPNARQEFSKLSLGYTDPAGSLELRQAIAAHYENITEADIIVFSGAEEGIFSVMQAVLSEGDQYVVQHPNYQSLEEIPRSIGCKVSLWRMSHHKDWSVDLEELRMLVEQGPRMIAINNPHNPTGYLMSHEDLEKTLRIADERGSYVFSDEVYRHSEYHLDDRLPAVCDIYERGISLGVMSKSYGLPGLRIGWIATKASEVLEKVALIKDYITICNSVPSEFLATLAMRNVDHLVERNNQIISRNLKLLDDFFTKNHERVRWVRPKAGPVAFPEIVLNVDITRFSEGLRDDAGVLILPGDIFQYDDQHFRMGFGRKNLPEALNRFESYLMNF